MAERKRLTEDAVIKVAAPLPPPIVIPVHRTTTGQYARQDQAHTFTCGCGCNVNAYGANVAITKADPRCTVCRS